MTEQNPQPVVVAVGHDPIDAALDFAVAEAARAGCGLHLIHVVHLIVQGPETMLVAETDLERAGRQALNAALEHARDVVPEGMPVTSDLRIGAVVPTLVDLARDARMIVLERRELSGMRRVVTRSVSGGVAAHARVPVVSVPTRWSAASGDAGVPPVTVGVDVADRAEQVLRAAIAEARSRGAVLRVLHTWRFAGSSDGIVLSRTESEGWTARATRELQSAIDALGDDVAGVTIRIEARHGYTADALIEASRDADLLVIGRHDPLIPIGSHLGPIARAVLREAHCPVLLTDPRPARGRQRRHHPAAEGAGQRV